MTRSAFSRKIVTTIVVYFCILTKVTAQLPWPVVSPEEVGISSASLNELFQYVHKHKTRIHSVHILRNGKLALDAYFYPFNDTSRHDVASVTKSITSTLVGIAADKKLIPTIKETMLTYYPEYKSNNQLKQKITLEDLLTMRSGFDCGAKINNPGVNDDRLLSAARNTTDWVQYMLSIPMLQNPGSNFFYCNANCHLLSGILNRATRMSTYAFAEKHLFTPLGITDVYWPADPKGVNYGWSDLQFHPHDMLKIGQLMLQQGGWNDKQLISRKWLDSATKARVFDTGSGDAYGYYWWKPGSKGYEDVFEAVGRGGQRITIWPSKNMVIVFTGGGFETSEVIGFIVNAIQSDRAIDANPTAVKELQQNVRLASQAQTKKIDAPLPKIAHVINGKQYKLSENNVSFKAVEFLFQGRDKAMMQLNWNGQKIDCTVGLDGQQQFSYNPLVRLQQACSGYWSNDTTLNITLDLVGAINCYSIQCRFTQHGRRLDMAVQEGTGLNKEIITGRFD